MTVQTTDLNDGLCVKAKDKTPWLDPEPVGKRIIQREARALCSPCPVLSECATFASQHRWAEVVVAGWRAGVAHPRSEGWAPPWVIDPSRHPVSPAALTVRAFLRERVTP